MAQLDAVELAQLPKALLDGLADRLDRLALVALGPAQRLGHDLVDDAQLDQILGGQLERLGGLLGLLAAAPQDRGAALRRDHRIDRVLQHDHLVGGRDRDRAARAALADDRADERHLESQAGLDGARDRRGLAALLGADPGIGAGAVDQRDDRQPEAVGEAHEALRLAVALGARHAEVVLDPAVGVGALLLADDHHGVAAEAADAADDRPVLAEQAVAGERREVLDQVGDIIRGMGTVGVARDLGLLPRGQLGIGLAQQTVRLGLQPRDLLGDVDLAIVREVAQFLDLAFEFRDRLFEIEEVVHGGSV